jgi:tetratricopeptide (TPR) repeat protein
MTKTALYNILAQAPGNTTVMDSLAMLYFQYQEFVSAALISQDIIAINPNDLLATEIAAVSFEQLGVPSKSIPLYEKMYLANNDISLLYQISFLQYSSKRYDESALNLETVIEDKLSLERFLVFPTADKQQQQVSLLAAAYRLKGMIEADQGNIDMATEAYNKALELVPDFQSVKDLKIDLGQ